MPETGVLVVLNRTSTLVSCPIGRIPDAGDNSICPVPPLTLAYAG